MHRFIRIVLLLVFSVSFVHGASAAGTRYSWKETDDTLSLMNGDLTVWRSNHAIGTVKHSIHPLAMVDGTSLTAFRPADHPWHRGCWFSWKILNGKNYWEEDRDGQSAGHTAIVKVTVRKGWFSKSAKIILHIIYYADKSEPLMEEDRIIRFSAPGKDGSYTMDWKSRFLAGEKELVLDRTPVPGEEGGVGHGGYAGFSLRLSRETIGWKFLNSSELVNGTMHGQPARWGIVSGLTSAGGNASISVFEHPDNPGAQSKWYVNTGMPYLSPAFLFARPLKVEAQEKFVLRYRVMIADEIISTEETESLWRKWADR